MSNFCKNVPLTCTEAHPPEKKNGVIFSYFFTLNTFLCTQQNIFFCLPAIYRLMQKKNNVPKFFARNFKLYAMVDNEPWR